MLQVLAVDVHPAARLGHGILLDHGTGVVIGETAVIGNNVSLLQVCCQSMMCAVSVSVPCTFPVAGVPLAYWHKLNCSVMLSCSGMW